MLKKIVKKITKTIGIKIVKYKREYFFNDFYNEVFKSTNPTIFDVGAHRGESIKRFRNLFPLCVIHSFEPGIQNFKILQQKYSNKKNIFLNNLGIGSYEGELQFNEYEKSNSSGFIEIDSQSSWAKLRAKQKKIKAESLFNPRTYKVKVKDLDSYVRDNRIEHIDILKIDTQGFEIEVLKGSKEILSKFAVDFIELEVIIAGPYKNSISFSDVESVLNPLGYKLYAIEKGCNYYNSTVLQFDVIFASEKAYVNKNI